jgi:hypothetical protein
MSYLIAISTHNGIDVDVPFGHAEKFALIEVSNNLSWRPIGERTLNVTDLESHGDNSKCSSCGSGSCGGDEPGRVDLHAARVELIKDCRCVVCSCAGPRVFRLLAQYNIACFDIVCRIQEAIDSIVKYYDKVDRGVSLRDS